MRRVWVSILTALVSGVIAGGVVAPASMAASSDPVVVDTVGARKPNGFWTLDPRMQPQIGQSFILDRPIAATSIVMHPIGIALAKTQKAFVTGYRVENFTYLSGRGVVNPVTVLNIWRSNDAAPLPFDPTPKKGGFDVLAGGFTNVYSRTYTVPFDLSRDFVLPFEPTLTLEPGVYLAAWYMQFPGQPVFGVRVEGEVSGHSGGTWRGNEWIPTICTYDPIPDSSPPGTAAYIADQWASPGGLAPSGPFPGTIGLQTWFRAGTDKGPESTGCTRPDFGGYNAQGKPIDKKGKLLKNPYDMKYSTNETGDIDMQIHGTFLPPSQ